MPLGGRRSRNLRRELWESPSFSVSPSGIHEAKRNIREGRFNKLYAIAGIAKTLNAVLAEAHQH
jgi:hypothetical protein